MPVPLEGMSNGLSMLNWLTIFKLSGLQSPQDSDVSISQVVLIKLANILKMLTAVFDTCEYLINVPYYLIYHA